MCGGMPGGTSLNSGRGPHVLLTMFGVGGRYSVPAAWAVLISESGISDSRVTAAHDSAHVSVTSTLRLNSMALPGDICPTRLYPATLPSNSTVMTTHHQGRQRVHQQTETADPIVADTPRFSAKVHGGFRSQ